LLSVFAYGEVHFLCLLVSVSHSEEFLV